MTLDLAPSFELASPATVSRGTVTAIGRTITWSMASFDASAATLSLRVRASGGASADGLFESISYVSSFESAPTLVQSPITSHPACEMADVTDAAGHYQRRCKTGHALSAEPADGAGRDRRRGDGQRICAGVCDYWCDQQ